MGHIVLLITCIIMAASYALISKAEVLEENARTKTALKRAIVYEVAGGGLLFAGTLGVLGVLILLI